MAGRKRSVRTPPGDHESAVADWERNARKHDDANFAFLRSLKFRDYGFDINEAAGELHRQAFEILDCTRCANCCRSMRVRLEPSDVERISGHLGMTPAEFTEKFLEPGQDGDDGLVMRQRPCPLLGDDNRCTVYDVRPAVCREFPHTDKEGIEFRTHGHANNALQCPAVFWIVEQLRERARRSP